MTAVTIGRRVGLPPCVRGRQCQTIPGQMLLPGVSTQTMHILPIGASSQNIRIGHLGITAGRIAGAQVRGVNDPGAPGFTCLSALARPALPAALLHYAGKLLAKPLDALALIMDLLYGRF